MSIYGKVPDSLKTATESFIEKGEMAEASKPVAYKENTYHEIIYSRKMLWAKSKDISGRIIVDGNGNLIKDKTLLMDLMKLFYYYCIFFDTRMIDINAIIKNDAQLKSEEQNFSAAKSALKYLSSQNDEGVRAVSEVFDGFLKMRKESNDVLKCMMDKIKGYDSQDTLYCYDVLNDILPLYKKSLLMSFERVKFINTSFRYYSDLRRLAAKKKKSMRYFTDAMFKNDLNQLQAKLGFFINVLKYYSEFLGYSNERYSRYLSKIETKNIETSFKMIRGV